GRDSWASLSNGGNSAQTHFRESRDVGVPFGLPGDSNVVASFQLAHSAPVRSNGQIVRTQGIKVGAGGDRGDRKASGQFAHCNLTLLLDQIENLSSALFG